MLRSRTSVTALVSAAFALLTSAGCGTNPSGGSGTTAKQPAAKVEKFASAEAAVAAVLSPITPPEDRAAATASLKARGAAALPAMVASVPEPGDRGWADGPLSLAELCAELAPADVPQRLELRRKATLATERCSAALDRQLKLDAMAVGLGASDGLGGPDMRLVRLKERHERLVASLQSPSR